MSLFKVYARALRYLGAYKLRVSLVVVANIVLAAITIAEPILFGRIIDAISESVDLPEERVFKTVHKYGNTSASSVGIALDELLVTHPPEVGEHILLAAFGAGLTWGASVLTKVVD